MAAKAQTKAAKTPVKHSKAAIAAHPAPVRADFANGAEYAEACRLVSEARTAFDAPKPEHPLMLNGKDWNKALVMDHLCDQLATTSNGIGTILKLGYQGRDLPSYSSIMAWLDADKELLDRYTRAKEAQADFMADEIMDIADNQVAEPLIIDVDGVETPVRDATGELVKVKSKVGVDHARLRIESRKWLASKLKPKKYGDKTTIAGDQENPLAVLTMDQITSNPNSRIKVK